MTTIPASALKDVFDRTFAEAADSATIETVDLLAIVLNGAPYALPLTSISSLHANKKITRIPTRAKGLLGIVGFRGVILPVYDLGALMGLTVCRDPHWLAMIAQDGVAIAFEKFEGHLRIPKSALVTNDSKEGGRQHLGHFIQSDHVVRGVIDLAAALRPITDQIS